MPKYWVETPQDPDLAFGGENYAFILAHARSMSELHPGVDFQIHAPDGLLTTFRAGETVYQRLDPQSEAT